MLALQGLDAGQVLPKVVAGEDGVLLRDPGHRLISVPAYRLGKYEDESSVADPNPLGSETFKIRIRIQNRDDLTRRVRIHSTGNH